MTFQLCKQAAPRGGFVLVPGAIRGRANADTHSFVKLGLGACVIYILGVDHWLQEYNLVADGEYLAGEPSAEELAYRRASKGRFYELVEGLIKQNTFAVLGEECKQGQDTIPRRLADEYGVKHVEIDMDTSTRPIAGIAKDYEKRPDEKAQGYRLREKHMFGEVQAARGDHGDVLIICGAIHVDGLARLFRESGADVDTKDISKEDWVENPFVRGFRLGLLP